jgi:CheY-like chemotaxis protein
MSTSKALGVLLVDDHVDTRELLAEFLMHEGYHSIMAANGQEALARLAYVQPDTIITDLDMPEMDGVELVRRLAGTPELSSIPVIVLTAIDADDARDRLGDLASHVRVILRKPVKLGALLQAVATSSSGATG